MCINCQLGQGERKGPGGLNHTGGKRGQQRTLGMGRKEVRKDAAGSCPEKLLEVAYL